MIEIRLATAEDITRLPDIERAAGRAFLTTQHAWIADDGVMEADDYAPLLAAGGVRVALADGVLAGFLAIQRRGDDLHVLEVAVRDDLQGQGIGRRLMDAAEAQALAEGCRALTLTTFRNVAFNAPFYQSLGYEILTAPPSHLAAILDAEARHGLTDRCAMRKLL